MANGQLITKTAEAPQLPIVKTDLSQLGGGGVIEQPKSEPVQIYRADTGEPVSQEQYMLEQSMRQPETQMQLAAGKLTPELEKAGFQVMGGASMMAGGSEVFLRREQEGKIRSYPAFYDVSKTGTGTLFVPKGSGMEGETVEMERGGEKVRVPVKEMEGKLIKAYSAAAGQKLELTTQSRTEELYTVPILPEVAGGKRFAAIFPQLSTLEQYQIIKQAAILKPETAGGGE